MCDLAAMLTTTSKQVRGHDCTVCGQVTSPDAWLYQVKDSNGKRSLAYFCDACLEREDLPLTVGNDVPYNNTLDIDKGDLAAIKSMLRLARMYQEWERKPDGSAYGMAKRAYWTCARIVAEKYM